MLYASRVAEVSLFCILGDTVLNACSIVEVCGASENQELPSNFIRLAKDVYTPDLMAASDCMLGSGLRLLV